MTMTFPNLPIELIKDENIYTVICRPLMISGYGDTIEKAQESFKIVFELTMQELIENGNLEKDLEEHGYKIEKDMVIPIHEFIGNKTLNLELVNA